MLAKYSLILLGLALVFPPPPCAAADPLTAPGGFVFDGLWNCSGTFVRSGKAHRSNYEGKSTPGDPWIELRETDLEPKGYIGHYLIAYDAGKKQVVELDSNNAGYAVYTGPGWEDRSLVLTSTDTGSYSSPSNRFVFEIKAANAFLVTWETKAGTEWVPADRLNCARTGETTAGEVPASVYVTPRLAPGQKLNNIFSRAISYKATGVDELVRRVSGTATYTLAESSAGTLAFDTTARYDGRPEAQGRSEIKDQGRTSCFGGTCGPSTDASGLLYNPVLWGTPPRTLAKGTTWDVAIDRPWELGPAGTQKVTVLSVDAADHSVTLQREGFGDGPFDGDPPELHVIKAGQPYTVAMNPGRSHWTGYATFREGIVMSDELLVERPITLTSKELGTTAGTERQYILLNAMP